MSGELEGKFTLPGVCGQLTAQSRNKIANWHGRQEKLQKIGIHRLIPATIHTKSSRPKHAQDYMFSIGWQS